jgi:cytochrome c biogenesis protein CcdA
MNILERIGSAICHQMAERSFIFDGMQMPLCARCTGIYTGVFLAFCFFFLKKRMGNSKPFSMPQTILTAAAVLPVGIDGAGSYLGFWESSQFLRILTGSIVGAVLPGFLLLAGNFEPDGKNEAVLYEKIRELLLLILVSVGFGFCLLAGMPLYWFGAVFSVGWTPCVGAFLGSALMLASQQGQTLTGVIMLLLYSLGLGIPFVVSALLIEKLKSAFTFIKKNYKIINLVSGLLLVLLGILMMTGLLNKLLTVIA